MLESFKKHIDQNLSFLEESKLIIAISGGVDSVVLTHLCHQAKLDIVLAHCNFNLRGRDSDADQQFVIDLANSLNLEVFIQSFDTTAYAKNHKLSIQMAARELRYDWFNELAQQLQFDYIVTGHHADDSLETFLINLSRGTGLDGLTGIPEQNDTIVRPLLPFSRDTIESHTQTYNLAWREDASNASDKYLRNALRLHVIPKLKELNPEILESFSTTTSHLRDVQHILEDRIRVIASEVISIKKDGEIHFNIAKIKKLSNPKAYLFQLLKDYGFSEWNDVVHLLEAQSGKQIYTATHRLVKSRNELILSEIQKKIDIEISIGDNQKRVALRHTAVLLFDEADAVFGKRTEVKDAHDKYANTIYVDKDLLKFPLSVRGWREGDYFYPYGMTGKKKLSKYFKDEKLALTDKEKVYLLCHKNDIIWVVGKRADDRFKVTEKTKRILKITIQE